MLRINITLNIEVGRKSLPQLTKVSWDRLRMLVKKRDDATCQYCGEEAQDGEADHIIPLSRGGIDSIDNLTWACKSCNRSKGSKMLDEWQLRPDGIEDSGLPIPTFLNRSLLPETFIHLGTGTVTIRNEDGEWIDISDEDYEALKRQYTIPITELNIPKNTPSIFSIPENDGLPPISHRRLTTDEEVIDL